VQERDGRELSGTTPLFYLEDHLSNENCLRDMRCPKCENEGPFKIRTTCTATVTDNGIEETVDHDWNPHDKCECPECLFSGIVENFMRSSDRTLCFECRELVRVGRTMVKPHRVHGICPFPTKLTVKGESADLCDECFNKLCIEYRDPHLHSVLMKTVVNFRFDVVRAKTQEEAIALIEEHAQELFETNLRRDRPKSGILDSVRTDVGVIKLLYREWGEEHFAAIVDQQFGEADDHAGSNWFFYDAEKGAWKKGAGA
jgi:hypothetical protein